MLLRADHRAIEDAGIGDSAAPVAAAPAGNDHAVQGTIAPPAPAAAIAPKQAAVAPPPPPAPAAPAATARVDAAPAVPVVSDKPQPVTKPSAPPPKVNVVTVDAQDSTRLRRRRPPNPCSRPHRHLPPRRSRNVRRASATASNATWPQPLRNEIRNAGDGRARQGIGEARPVVAAAVDVIGVVDAGEHRFVPAGQFVIGCESGCRRDDRATGQAVEQFQVDGACASGRKPDRDQVTANAFGIKGPRMPTKACGAKRDKLLCRRSDARYAATASSACGCAAATGATS